MIGWYWLPVAVVATVLLCVIVVRSRHRNPMSANVKTQSPQLKLSVSGDLQSSSDTPLYDDVANNGLITLETWRDENGTLRSPLGTVYEDAFGQSTGVQPSGVSFIEPVKVESRLKTMRDKKIRGRKRVG